MRIVYLGTLTNYFFCWTVDEKYFYVIFIYNYLMFNVFMIIRVAVNVYIYTVQKGGQIPPFPP